MNIARTLAVVSLLACLAIQVESPARALPDKQEFAAAIGRQGYGRCHMDSCGFFIIDAAAPVGSGRRGTLFAVAYRGWGASYRHTDDDQEYESKPINVSKPDSRLSLVFCSKTDPSEFYLVDGKWLETPIRPGDDQAIFGANESSYMFYYAACHNHITKDPLLPAGLARKLGYDLHGGFPDSPAGAPDRQPLDMLK
jgi:hypothetical protein